MLPGVELVGNALCLDLTNTVNARPSPSRDWLADATGAQTWAQAVGGEVSRESVDARALAAARAFREHVFRIFEAVVRDAEPPRSDVAALRGACAGALARARLVADPEHRFRLDWPQDGTLTPLVDKAAHSAVDLLLHGQLDRLGQCPTCGWLFLDTSRNGRRRWCSMATCGARDKARRHYRSRQRS
jgi:predicted RNA-binding Zn ribbon-like protein